MQDKETNSVVGADSFDVIAASGTININWTESETLTHTNEFQRKPITITEY
jgi:hypothetical protein